MISVLLSTLLIVTDPHVLAPELHDNGKAFRTYVGTAGGRDLEKSTDLWEAFLERALQEKPQAVLVTGDLTNQGERPSHLLVAAGLERLERQGIRTFVVPGNHDVANPWARGFQGTQQVVTESVTAEEFSQIYAHSGFDEALDRDQDSLSYLVSLTPHQWILMLDSAVYDTNALLGYPDLRGVFTDRSLAWIAACGKKARAAGAQLIAALHHNVTDHSPVIRDGYTVDNADELSQVLSEAGIEVVFTGHIHIQDIAVRTTAKGPLFDVVTNALSVSPNHYGRVTWSPDALVYQALPVVEAGSPLAVHARAVFRSGVGRLFSGEGRELMATLNENYFAGRETQNQALSERSEFAALAAAEGFRGDYVLSLLKDFDDIPDSHLEIR